jgi:type IV pilus assembly protein PilA
MAGIGGDLPGLSNRLSLIADRFFTNNGHSNPRIKSVEDSSIMTRRRGKNLYGFTFIELAVVILILMVLAAIFLPGFLNQRACAHVGNEASQYVGSLAQAQQAFYLEESRFAKLFSELSPTLHQAYYSRSKNYNYSIEVHHEKTFIYGKAKHPLMKSYVSGVFVQKDQKELTTRSIICVALKPGLQPISTPTNSITCGESTTKALRDC